MSSLEEANAHLQNAKTDYDKGCNAALAGKDKSTELKATLGGMLLTLKDLQGQQANASTTFGEAKGHAGAMHEANTLAHGSLVEGSQGTTNPTLFDARQASDALIRGFVSTDAETGFGAAAKEEIDERITQIGTHLAALIQLVEETDGSAFVLETSFKGNAELGAQVANAISDYQQETGLPQ